MGTIHLLDQLIANKIAAGEVVERPASVVKELVENALDAAAGTVAVSVNHGGKSRILVRDNGIGMDRDDARACLLRHATSKISAVEDIQTIATMGFRGEALPSIASVSRLKLTTRRSCDDTATCIVSNGGSIDSVSECAAEPGTTVEVSDLFYNVPARKKFMKSDAAESHAIMDAFNALALARTDVSFSLMRNNTPAADYPACDSLLERIRQQFDPDFADRLYPVEMAKDGFSVSGYIGAPENCRINRTGQRFFINARSVQSTALSSALSRGFDEFLERGRFPVAVLFLSIDPALVDVNVHPAKREVRLSNERFFIDVLVRHVRGVLRERGFLFERRPAQSMFTLPAEYSGDDKSSSPQTVQQVKEAASAWRAATFRDWTAASTPRCGPDRETLFSAPQQGALPGGPARVLDVRSVLGQALGTYIVAEASEGVLLIDQHAAHERIIFEQLLGRISRQRSHCQTLAFPFTLHLDLKQREIFEACLPDFQKMGFSVNRLGENSFSVDAVPACIPAAKAEQVLRDSLHELIEQHRASSFAEHSEEAAAILACKTYAVKAGKALTTEDMNELADQLSACTNPHTCPHGRPTCFILSRNELERRFKRK